MWWIIGVVFGGLLVCYVCFLLGYHFDDITKYKSKRVLLKEIIFLLERHLSRSELDSRQINSILKYLIDKDDK